MRTGLVVLFSLLAACPAITGPDDVERRLGIIHFTDHDSVVFDVPDTVQRATPFDVSIRTYGGGCIRQGDTEVSRSGNVAEIRPFDFHALGNRVCTAELRHYNHRVTLEFGTTGSATVRARGIKSGPPAVEITRERSVVVR